MKMTMSDGNRMVPHYRSDSAVLERRQYTAPVVTRMELASVIAGAGGSVLDDSFQGTKHQGQVG